MQRARAPIEIEERGPLTIVTYNEKATDSEYRAYLEEMTAIVERGRRLYRRVAVINDTTRWMHSSATQRRMQADWMTKHEAEMRFRTAGVVFVITSAFVRGGLNAVFWLSPLPCPHKICATMDEALTWANQALHGQVELAGDG